MNLPGLLPYDVVIPATAFTGQVDIVEINLASTQCAWLIGYDIGQGTELGDAQEEEVLLQWITGHATSGSGGSTATPAGNGHVITWPGTSNVVETFNTTIASTGTAVTRRATYWNVRAGSVMMWDPSKWLFLPQSTRLVLRAPAPTDSITAGATIHLLSTP